MKEAAATDLGSSRARVIREQDSLAALPTGSYGPGNTPLAADFSVPVSDSVPASPTILIIDDDLFVCRAVACIVREARSVVVHAAREGEEALQVAAVAQPDLIFLDIMLPGMSAPEICRALRQMPQLQHTPICILTGILPEAHVLRDLEPFVDSVLTKPPDPRKIVALMDEYWSW